ncbi:MAG: hypothetical protein CMJ94_14790 [Planctomycetes bacterium]|nr:hypothetical protein [Planctomycetota bacterium]
MIRVRTGAVCLGDKSPAGAIVITIEIAPATDRIAHTWVIHIAPGHVHRQDPTTQREENRFYALDLAVNKGLPLTNSDLHIAEIGISNQARVSSTVNPLPSSALTVLDRTLFRTKKDLERTIELTHLIGQ